jgi:hypothetical protein
VAAESGRIPANLRVWNPQPWGSWLEIAIPGACHVICVATDSRVELFPAELWRDVRQVSTGTGDWLAILDRHMVDVLVLTDAETRRLAGTLNASGRWAQRYADADGSIWVLYGSATPPS